MPNITKKQAQKIDKILSYSLQNYKETNYDIIETYVIADRLDLDEAEVDRLFEILVYSIEFEGDKVVKTFNDTDSIIKLNYNTEEFMKSGGAVEWFNQELKKQQKEETKKELEQVNLENAIKQFELSQKEYRHTKKVSRISMIVAIIGGLIALATLILQVLDVI